MANNDFKNYTELDRPYNTYLQRDEPLETAISGLPNDNLPGESKPVKSGKFLDNVFLNTWIKSTGYKPKRQGFYLDGKTGYFELNGQFDIGSGSGFTGVTLKSNDTYYFDDSVGGQSPVTGNVASIYFVRSDDEDPYNPVLSSEPRAVIQKRKGVSSNSQNVLEIFYDQVAAGNGKNYIFIGTRGDVDTSADVNPLDFPTNVVQSTASDTISLGLFSAYAGPRPSSFQIYNNKYIGSTLMNNDGNRMNLVYYDTNPTDAVSPSNFGTTWKGGGLMMAAWNPAGGVLNMILDSVNNWSALDFLPWDSLNLGNNTYPWNRLYANATFFTPTTAPAGATEGAIYASAANHTLYFYNGTGWIDLANATGMTSAGVGTSLPSPASSYTNQYYYRTDTDTLYRSNGTAWIALN